MKPNERREGGPGDRVPRPSPPGPSASRTGARRSARDAVPVHTIPVPTPFPVGPVNVHLIARDPVTLVDTGPLSDEAWELLRAGLARRGLAPGDVRRVLLTHGHQDHFGLAARLARGGADLWGGVLDRSHFAMRRNTRMLLDAMTRHGFGAATRLAVTASTAGVDTYSEALQEWNGLHGGEVLPGDGYSVLVRSVPGHTPGSLTFEVPEAGILFTGDTVLRDITPNAIVDEDPLHPGETFRSVSRYFESLEALGAAAPGAELLTGHGRRIPDFASHREKLEGKYRLRVDQVVRTLAGGPRTVSEMVASMFPGVDAVHIYLAYSEALGFLMYLEDLGRVERIRGSRIDRFRLAA